MSLPWTWDLATQATDDEAEGYQLGADDAPQPTEWYVEHEIERREDQA